eukprot:6213173-Pleurochrysis_carterae.AAC.4
MSSGLEKGPKNSRSTRRDGDARSWLRRERGAGSATSDSSARSGGKPGGCKGSPSDGCAIVSIDFEVSDQGTTFRRNRHPR